MKKKMIMKFEEPVIATSEEELRFIFEGALAPFFIVKRIVVDHEKLSSALLQTIDRDANVKAQRASKTRNAI